MSLKEEFVRLATPEGANVSELCRRFEISRETGYRWLKRYACEGVAGLAERSRRPQHLPKKTSAEITAQLLALRRKHPSWGPRKLRRRLADLGVTGLPAPSTVAAILLREGYVTEVQSAEHQPWVRFERSTPNALWQMDFKGHVELSRGGRCHPLTVLDDHTRYLLSLNACANEQGTTVRAHLHTVFSRYGLPEDLLCDNGGPWSGRGGDWSTLGVWLLRLGIRLCHGRPFHPQTQGKDERLHRTLNAEVLSRSNLRDLGHSQQVFDSWRSIYNTERPHQALDLATPASRYTASLRSYPNTLPDIVYAPDDLLFTVRAKGEITWRRRTYYVGQAFAREPVALRSSATDGLYHLFYCHQLLGSIDLSAPPPRNSHHYLPLLKLTLNSTI